MKYWALSTIVGAVLAVSRIVPAQEDVTKERNGHWYQFVDAGRPISFVDAKSMAEGMSSRGFKGHLLTVTSPEELQFVVKNVLTPLPTAQECAWLGIVQKRGAAEPAAGWEWITGEPMDFKNWAPGEPNDTNRNEYLAQIRRDGVWGDVPRTMFRPFYVVEFEDPKGLTPVTPEEAPQEFNCHYYQLVEAGRQQSWIDAESVARGMTYRGLKGHLATITSAEEQKFIARIATLMRFDGELAWLGGSQMPDSQEPAGGWRWSTGEPFGFTFWGPGQPDNAGQEESLLQMWRHGHWNDNTDSPTVYSIVEYEEGK